MLYFLIQTSYAHFLLLSLIRFDDFNSHFDFNIIFGILQRNWNIILLFRMDRRLSKQRRRYSQLKYHQSSTPGRDQLFKQASFYPDFFNENLVDDDRKIKIFSRQKHSHEIIFYFQLLKLTFECDDVDYQKYLQRIYDVLENPEFEMIIPKNNHPFSVSISSSKAKKILAEFLEQLGEGEMGVEQSLNKYPIINKIFVIFLRSMLILSDICQSFDELVQPSQLYDFFANYFDIDVTYYGSCLRFNQVDIFAYLESDQTVYMAYISPSISQHQILDTTQLYHNEEALNISSVKQMVSEIEIPVDTQCFDTSKIADNLEDTDEIEYNYSNSDGRVCCRSLVHEPSQLKFSYLIGQDSSSLLQSLNVVKSNKVLEKELIGEKKEGVCFKNMNTIKFSNQNECFLIEQVPQEFENASTPALTPRQSRFVSFGKQEAKKFDKENIYRAKKISNMKDSIKQQYELLSTYESGFRQQTYKDTVQSEWQAFKRQSEQVLGHKNQSKPNGTLKSLYELKSIKSICGSEGQSMFLDPSANISKLVSKKPTIMDRFIETPERPKVSNNTSTDFTNSFILKQMQQPYQSNIRSIKVRSRENRGNVQKLMFF